MDDKLHILLMEDEESLCKVAETQLKRRGYEVTAVSHADNALEAINNAHNYDLLVTDLQVPLGESDIISSQESDGGRSAGIVVAEEFRRKFRRAPIIVWSAYESYSIVEKLRSIGNARFLNKRSGNIIDYVEGILHGFQNSNRPRVFIVHGHDEQTMHELKQFIISKLKFPCPTVLRDESSNNQTVIEKLESYSSRIDLVFVLLTPDDKVIEKDGDQVYRARQNVLFELGLFIGMLGRNTGRVIILYRKPIELPSDIDGIICIDVTEGIEAAGSEISRELQEWL